VSARVVLFRSPLFRRLLGAVAALSLLPLAATAIGAALLLRGVARDATAAELRSDALLAREAALPLFRAGDAAALDGLAKRLGREIRARLTFLDVDGRVLGDSDHDPATMENHAGRPEVADARERGEGTARRFSDTLQEELIFVAVRAEPAEASRGIVRAALPTRTLAARLQAVYAGVALLAAAFGLAALLSAAISLGIFASAVHDLTEAAESAGGGGDGAPVVRRTTAEEREDEVGALARAVRAMADRLFRQIEEIARARNELTTVVESLGEGLVAVDGGGRILFVNGAAERLLELAAPPRAGAPLADALPNGEVIGLAREVLETGRAAEARLVIVRAQGGARSIEARAAPLGRRPERAEGAVVLLRDVTEVERYEELRRDFVANVSHELRTPVALIKGFLETLEDGALRDPVDGPRFLEILRRHVLGLDRLVADLLTLSTLEAGADTRPREPVALADAVGAVLGPFETVLAEKRLRLTRRLPDGLPPVLAHRDLVERAIRNLVDNAVKFTPEGGAIEVEAAARGAAVALTVRDSGPGISAEERARVFERFYRVEKSRSREAGGTGLGLAIVKHIAQQEGGAVEVASEIGRGSAFTLTLPRA
jgi:two-component system phosphate regulon sensor histidine kinase PhoR